MEGMGDGGGIGEDGRGGGGGAYNNAMRGDVAMDGGFADNGNAAAGTGGAGSAEGATGLSPEEEEYVRQYGDLLAVYKGKWTDVDLTGSLEPPRDLFIDVRVLKDAGEIQTEYGCVFISLSS